MSKPAQGEISPYYPFILVKPIFVPKMSEYGIEVAGAEPDRIPVEVEVVAFPEDFDEENGYDEVRFFTHVGERIFVRDFSSPELKDGYYFVHEKDVMGYRKEEGVEK